MCVCVDDLTRERVYTQKRALKRAFACDSLIVLCGR